MVNFEKKLGLGQAPPPSLGQIPNFYRKFVLKAPLRTIHIPVAGQCLPGSRTEHIVEVDMEGKGDWLKDDDVEEEEDTVGEDRPGY